MLPNKNNCFVFHQTKNVDEEFKADGFADVTSTFKYEFTHLASTLNYAFDVSVNA
jgi:hypothetical protein